jgi:hypothetical protein
MWFLKFNSLAFSQVLCDLCLEYYQPAGDSVGCELAAQQAEILAVEHGLGACAASARTALEWSRRHCSRF